MSRSVKVAAVVSIAMAGLLLAAWQYGRTLRASHALQELPSTARAVLRIDTAAVARTPTAQTLIEAFVPEEQLSEIQAVCGLDPLTSLSEATLWVRGTEDQPFQSIGLMLRGRTADATALTQCHRLLVESRGGSIVRVDGPSGALLASRDRRSAVGVLDEHTIVTGSIGTVSEALAVRHGGAPALRNRARIAALWPRVNAGASIAAAFDPPTHWRSAFERVAKLGDEASAMRGLEGIGLSVESGSERTLHLYIEIDDAELAAENARVIEGWSTKPPETVQPPWTDVLRSARVQVRGRTIEVALDVSSLEPSR